MPSSSSIPNSGTVAAEAARDDVRPNQCQCSVSSASPKKPSSKVLGTGPEINIYSGSVCPEPPQKECCSQPSVIPGVVTGLASLGWPIVVFLIAVMFKNSIQRLMRRIKAWDGFGNRLEFAELDRLERGVEQIDRGSPVDRVEISGPIPETREELNRVESPVDEVLQAIKTSPETGLMTLTRQIEKELRYLAAAAGVNKSDRPVGLRQLLEDLRKQKLLPGVLGSYINEFVAVRNKIVHGNHVEDGLVRKAIDVGLDILRAILALPRGRHIVLEVRVGLFSDPDLTCPIQGVYGLILTMDEPTGIRKRRIVPTRMIYEVGQQVSWEWDWDRRVGEAYVLDRHSNVITHVWHSSAEFVGRPLSLE